MSLANRKGWFWIDGQWTPWDAANTHLLTHTLHYGLGVFEGLRCYNTDKGPAIFRLAEHTARLLRSAELLQLPIPYDSAQLNRAQCEVVRKNNLSSAYLRPMAYYGSEYLGLQTKALSSHVMIAAWEWTDYFNAKTEGLDVILSSYCRHSHRCVPTKAKANGFYVNSILALAEANKKGAQEALMLDLEGNLAEGSSANVFLVKSGELFTPDSPDILDGITRDTVVTLAKSLGITVHFQPLTLEDIGQAQEMFFTGSAAEIAPVRLFEGSPIGSGKPGPITLQLRDTFQALVMGRLPAFSNWLTYL